MRPRSKSVDIGRQGLGLLNAGNLSKSSRKLCDFSSTFGHSLLVPKSMDALNTIGCGRKSVDVLRSRAPSRLSVAPGARRNMSYDAWIRGVRVSILMIHV